MKKNVLVVLVFLIVFSTAVYAKVKLEFWHMWTGHEAAALQEIVDEFNKSQNQIEVVLVSADYQKQLTALAAGTGPDIGGNFAFNVPAWGSEGAMLDLTNYIKRDNYNLGDFIPAALQMVTYRGRIYALPIAMHTYMIYYNKKFLEEAGYKEFPSTISEFEKMVLKLTVEKDGKLERIGFLPTNIFAMASIFGTRYISGNTFLLDRGLIQAYKFTKELVDKMGGIEKLQRFQSTFGGYMSPDNPFFVGKIAAIIDGEWLNTFIQLYAPNFDYGIAPIPYPDNRPDLRNSSYADASVFYISAYSKHKEEAWTFLKWIVSKDTMVKFTSKISNLPTRKSATTHPVFKNMKGFREFLEYSQKPNVKPLPVVRPLNILISEMIAQYDLVLAGKITPEQAVRKIKEKMDVELRK